MSILASCRKKNHKFSAADHALTAKEPIRISARLQQRTACQMTGFTLVELLVIVAIACILMSLLQPALQKTLLTARLSSCAGNQRQFSIAFSTYSDDYRGVMPAPWNVGYENRMQDVGGPDRLLPIGLSVFYRDNYLDNGALVLCPDTDPTYPVAPLISSLDYVSTHGEFESPLVARTSTYVINIASMPRYKTAGNHVWDWANYVGYYDRVGIASRVSGNLPGGRLFHAVNNVQRRLRSPLPYLACGFPSSHQSYNPHHLNSFNALYADGVIQRIILDPLTYHELKTQNQPYGGFSYVIAQRYPNYQPPQ